MSRSRKQRVAMDLGGVMGPEKLFRLSGAVKRDPSIDEWFANATPALARMAEHWFATMRECGDDVLELIHDGCPVACVADAPFGYVNAFKKHVNIGFFHGASLQDPTKMLEGSGKHMRHVKLTPDRKIDEAALRRLIKLAYNDIKTTPARENPKS